MELAMLNYLAGSLVGIPIVRMAWAFAWSALEDGIQIIDVLVHYQFMSCLVLETTMSIVCQKDWAPRMIPVLFRHFVAVSSDQGSKAILRPLWLCCDLCDYCGYTVTSVIMLWSLWLLWLYCDICGYAVTFVTTVTILWPLWPLKMGWNILSSNHFPFVAIPRSTTIKFVRDEDLCKVSVRVAARGIGECAGMCLGSSKHPCSGFRYTDGFCYLKQLTNPAAIPDNGLCYSTM